jgi:hypothetical protein
MHLIRPLLLTRSFGIVLRVLPVLVIVILSAPAWLTWPFLPADRQQVVLDMVKELAAWTRGENERVPSDDERSDTPDDHDWRPVA